MTPPIVLRRVDLVQDAALVRDIADWIDREVRVGTDQAEQLRAIASFLEQWGLIWQLREETRP